MGIPPKVICLLARLFIEDKGNGDTPCFDQCCSTRGQRLHALGTAHSYSFVDTMLSRKILVSGVRADWQIIDGCGIQRGYPCLLHNDVPEFYITVTASFPRCRPSVRRVMLQARAKSSKKIPNPASLSLNPCVRAQCLQGHPKYQYIISEVTQKDEPCQDDFHENMAFRLLLLGAFTSRVKGGHPFFPPSETLPRQKMIYRGDPTMKKAAERTAVIIALRHEAGRSCAWIREGTLRPEGIPR